MAQTADIPLDVMARAGKLLGDGDVSLLKVERAIGQRCSCRDPSENAGCLPHKIYAMLCDGFDNWIELYSENEIAYRVEGKDLLDKDQVQEKVDTAVADVEEKVDAVKEELEEAKDEVEGRDVEINELRAVVHTLTVALGEEKAAALLDDPTYVDEFAEREAEARAKFEADTRAKIREHFAAELELAQTRAANAEAKLQQSKTYAKYERDREKREKLDAEGAGAAAPLMREEIDAVAARWCVPLDEKLRLANGDRLAHMTAYQTPFYVLQTYGKQDLHLRHRNLADLELRLADARVTMLVNELDALRREGAVDAAVAAAPTAPASPPSPGTGGVVIEGKDAYEVARHLAMQPSGLQAMLEIARAQRPAEFKRKGK